MNPDKPPSKPTDRWTPRPWSRGLLGAASLTAVTAFLLVFFEWLFFVTKPSFLLAADYWSQMIILAVVPWVFSIPAILMSFIAVGLTGWHSPANAARSSLLGAAVLASLLVMLLIDNFTYTLFQSRIFDLHGTWQVMGLLAWLSLTAFLIVRMTRWLAAPIVHRTVVWCATLMTLAALLAILTVARDSDFQEVEATSRLPIKLPNIIIFSADGLDIRRLGAFGYQRNTSPFLSRMLDQGLAFENSFTNSATTTGSMGAMLTGRLPTTTRVNFRPDVFRPADTFRHLPGVLRTLGYRSAEITTRYYIDADDFNLRRAFHWANGRSLDRGTTVRLPTSWLGAWNFEYFFFQQIWNRISQRVWHLAGRERTTDPYQEVMQQVKVNPDIDRLQQLRSFIESTPEPFFISTHFMVTHGATFPVYTRKFSAQREQRGAWMPDFYDDALLDVDLYLNLIFDFLNARGQLENTLIVYTTDHGERSKSNGTEQRLPLVFFFPGQEHAGRRTTNAQRIDIAPTLLDYLGVRIPDWMEGQSLISGSLPATRPTIGTGTGPGAKVGKHFEIRDVEPPLYTLQSVYMIQCQRYWRLDLRSGQWSSRNVAGHTDPCSEESMFDTVQAKQYLIDHLLERDYPVTALEKAAQAAPKAHLAPID